MARGLNRVFLIGALAAPPDMRYTPGGLAVLDLTLAGQDFLESGGQGREVPWYHRVRLLGRQAEMWGDTLKKGQLLFVEGRLEYRQWEREGEKRSELQVRGEFVDPLEPRGRETQEDARSQPRLRHALNQVLLMGNLTRDPDLRYTPQGTAVARLGLAVNERRRGQGGEEERTHFIEVQAWRELAEWAGELRRGDGLLVIGRLVNDSWTGSNGERRFQTRVEALRLEQPTRGPAQAGGSGSQDAPKARPAQTGGVDIDDGLEDFPPEEDLPF
ncbi:MAG: single-stranded DNA-binding protein [Thermus sp.]|uniref:single-stranded DNA-binding protein n=1 Tax=Thermus sp. TaxID=275 RepID=UPI0025DD27EE|nr:single-stranded DNA-binding protein [Thermus sp.]MCS6869048.1 single-stranded DNA-binding protein [Thermus sp.]MCS7217772.1 single-stranded DNA-binding protein [Thermus sp.]MCX7849561.1 single-stranded DNA-binding protein [Thermus sp.]MDW8016590.1 single-stranded DNA-binding protein [Thermus sp.]MDW8356489.1 single-stranded DNA-binding protein [Thermus sp.]